MRKFQITPVHLGLGAAISTISIVGFGITLMIPVLSLEMERRGVTGSMIGLQTAVMAFASILGSLFAPRLLQLMNIRFIIVLALAINASMFPLFHFVENIWWWFPMRAISGFCFALLFTASEFWITSIAPPQSRGLVMGIYATCLSIGFALGPTLLTLTGTQGLLPLVVGAIIIASGILPALIPHAARPQIHHDEKPSSFFTVLRIAPIAIFASLIFGAIESTNFSFLAIWGVRSGLSETQGALLITMIGIGNALLQIPIGLLADRWNRRWMIISCALFSAGLFFLAPFAVHAHAWLLYALLIPFGGVVAGIYTVGLSILGERFSGAMLASANAAFVTAYAAGMLVVPPVAGRGMDIVNPNGYVYVTVILLVIYALFIIFSARKSVSSP
ncbi:MAG: MFS transporter [Pseudomonadota bacterium]